MPTLKHNFSKILIATCLLTAGCATKSDINTVRNDINSLRSTAETALTTSEEAKQAVTRNQIELSELRELINATNELIKQNETIMNRMFDDSLKK